MWPGGLIDFHHHVIPPALSKELADSLGAGGKSRLQMPSWSRDGMLSFMDENTIGTAVASVAVNVCSADTAATVKTVRDCNDFLAGLVRARPDRFGGFGLLPLPYVQESLAELDRVFDDLGLDGVVLSTNYMGTYLGDPAFDTVFEALERRGALVFVHPTASPDAVAHTLGIPDLVRPDGRHQCGVRQRDTRECPGPVPPPPLRHRDRLPEAGARPDLRCDRHIPAGVRQRPALLHGHGGKGSHSHQLGRLCFCRSPGRHRMGKCEAPAAAPGRLRIEDLHGVQGSAAHYGLCSVI